MGQGWGVKAGSPLLGDMSQGPQAQGGTESPGETWFDHPLQTQTGTQLPLCLHLGPGGGLGSCPHQIRDEKDGLARLLCQAVLFFYRPPWDDTSREPLPGVAPLSWISQTPELRLNKLLLMINYPASSVLFQQHRRIQDRMRSWDRG